MATATRAISIKSFGNIRVLAVDVNSNTQSYTVNTNKIEYASIYNASNVPIAINFNGSDSSLRTHYRTLNPGEEFSNINVSRGTTIEYRTLSGSGSKRMEITLWG